MGSETRRIILTGAGGVGKTLLAEALASVLNLPVIPELGRKLCEAMGYKQIGEIPEQEKFKQQVLDAQIAEEETPSSFIAGRSTIDCAVLWQRWNIYPAMTYDTERYYESARLQARSYTDILYVPPMFPPEDDGFRWNEPDYQKQ